MPEHALHDASLNGHETVVKELLDNDADVNVDGGFYGNALQAASYNGHENIVRLLLERDVNINAEGGKYGSALQAASYKGHKNIVEMLLKRNANVNAPGGFYGNALQAASDAGHENIVKMLIDKEANVYDPGIYKNAMYAASAGHNANVVRMLLNNAPDDEELKERCQHALDAATNLGYEDIVQIIVEIGANVNPKREGYGHALKIASLKGCETIVKILLDSGADVNSKEWVSDSALQLASAEGHETIVQMLLDYHANETTFRDLWGTDPKPEKIDDTRHQTMINFVVEAGIHFEDKDFKKAYISILKAVPLADTTAGKLVTIKFLASILARLQKFDKALDLLKSVLEMEKELSDSDPTWDTSHTMHDIGTIYVEKVKIERRKSDPDMTKIRTYIKEAEDMLLKALRENEGYPDNESTLKTKRNLGILYLYDGRLDDAKKYVPDLNMDKNSSSSDE